MDEERKENSAPAAIAEETKRKAYRPARRTRSLPAKKYGGAEREVGGGLFLSAKIQ